MDFLSKFSIITAILNTISCTGDPMKQLSALLIAGCFSFSAYAGTTANTITSAALQGIHHQHPVSAENHSLFNYGGKDLYRSDIAAFDDNNNQTNIA